MASLTTITATMLFNLFLMTTAYANNLPVVPSALQGEHNSAELTKRYPSHLNPAMAKFWIQVGECPPASDGVKQWYCPSINENGRQVCIDDHHLCNGVKECPNAEDEDNNYCLFYHALKSQVQLLERSMATLSSQNNMKTPSRRYVNYYDPYNY